MINLLTEKTKEPDKDNGYNMVLKSNKKKTAKFL